MSTPNEEILVEKVSEDVENHYYNHLFSWIIGSLAMVGIIIASFNNSWAIALGAGIVLTIAHFILKGLISDKPSYVYLTASIVGLMGSMIVFQTSGNFLSLFLILLLLPTLIIFNNWKVYIPFVLVVLVTVVISYATIGRDNFIWVADIIGKHTGMLMYVGFLFASAVFCGFLSNRLASITSRNGQLKDKLQQLQEYESNNIEFAKQISSGNFNASYNLQENDVLGQSLIEMSKNLKHASIEEKQRNWSVEGIARTADILRVNHENLNELSYNVISHLVKYMKANQGGMFIINDEDPDHKFLELQGCYAYERRKFIEKQVEIGQGLIGQAYLEKEIIYMTDVPENYVHIKSGLGDANPGCIMIVPIKMEQQVIGIIELASFQDFQPHERMFLEKVSENIASAIISSKVKDQTDKLLREAQEMTEEMRAQEEEMRQNMEELQATQESLHRESREKEKIQQEIVKTRDFLQNIINAIPDPVFVKTKEEHRFVMVNKAWSDSYSGGKDVIGKNDFDLFPKELAEVFYKDEEKIFNDKTEFTAEEKGVRNGEEIYNITKKRVIENEFGETFLVGINHDITELKKVEKDFAKEKYLLEALMTHSTDSIYFKDLESKFIRISNNMLKSFNVNSQDEVTGKSDFNFFTEEHARPAFESEQEIIKSEKPILNLTEKETWEDGRVTYVSTSKMPLRDLNGKIVGTFGISRDITQEKLRELEFISNERMLGSIFKYINQSVWVTDRQMITKFVSSVIMNHLEYTTEELNDYSLWDIVHPQDKELLEKSLKNLGKESKPVSVRFKSKDGKYMKWITVIVNALEDKAIEGIILKLNIP